MTYRGTVKGGVVVLEDPNVLPEGTEVAVSPAEENIDAQELPVAPAWDDVLKDFIGQADGLPSDMARNHDHYIHGASKR
jgi:hypothetical protein